MSESSRDPLPATDREDVPICTAAAPPAIPDYLTLEQIGRGGQGVVYRARQLSLPRTVALKLLRDWQQVDPERLRDLRQEAEKLAGLQHPNAVTVHAFGLHQGCPYLALEYVGGGSLARKLAGRPQPPEQRAVDRRRHAQDHRLRAGQARGRCGDAVGGRDQGDAGVHGLGAGDR
jgi:serine/threonine protein kinase